MLGIGLNVAVQVEELPELRTPPPAWVSRAKIEPLLAQTPQDALRAASSGPRRPRSSTRRARATRCRAGIFVGSGGTGALDGIDGEGRLIIALAPVGAHHTRRRGGSSRGGVGRPAVSGQAIAVRSSSVQRSQQAVDGFQHSPIGDRRQSDWSARGHSWLGGRACFPTVSGVGAVGVKSASDTRFLALPTRMSHPGCWNGRRLRAIGGNFGRAAVYSQGS